MMIISRADLLEIKISLKNSAQNFKRFLAEIVKHRLPLHLVQAREHHLSRSSWSF
jgi:hypothetical protein